MQKLIIGFSWKLIFTKKRLKMYCIIVSALLVLFLSSFFYEIFVWIFAYAAGTAICLVPVELAFIPITRQFKELGLFLKPDWFLQYGIYGVVTFTGLREERGSIFSGMDFSWHVCYSCILHKFYARGINPVTHEEQEFVQLYTGDDIALPHNRRRFQPGDKLLIYVHPEKPKQIYWINL